MVKPPTCFASRPFLFEFSRLGAMVLLGLAWLGVTPDLGSADEPSLANSFWFPDWDVPQWGWTWGPILGASYQEDNVGQDESTRLLTLEGGLRLSIDHLPLYVDAPTEAELPIDVDTVPPAIRVTATPRVGYAYGQAVFVDEGEDDQTGASVTDADEQASRSLAEGSYHRVNAGVTVFTFFQAFRYSLGVQYGGLLGDSSLGLPRNQLELGQDFALRLTRRSSLHLTPVFGRIFGDIWSSFTTQYSDLWLHWTYRPFASFAVDLGPGLTWVWLPKSDTGAQGLDWRTHVSWQVWGPLLVDLRGRYEIESQIDSPLNSSAATLVTPTREPLRDLGVPASYGLRRADDLEVLGFVGLKGVLLGWSVGYMVLYEMTHALEREGTRSTRSTQGLGLYGQITL